MTVARGVNRAPRPSSLADVLEVVLDKGIVIDAYVRVAVVGIELLTIDARIVIASVDTYLRFAEATHRLDLQPNEQVSGLPGLMDELTEDGSKHKTKGALEGVRDTARDIVSSARGDEDDDDGGRQREERPRRRTAAPRTRRASSNGSRAR